MSFSSSIAALGGDGFGVSDHRGGRHVTHVASLSDPLPEDVPRWEAGVGEDECRFGRVVLDGQKRKDKGFKKKGHTHNSFPVRGSHRVAHFL